MPRLPLIKYNHNCFLNLFGENVYLFVTLAIAIFFHLACEHLFWRLGCVKIKIIIVLSVTLNAGK